MTWLRPRALLTRPTVSVVIPCYNYGHFLPDALASITDQTGVELDIIIVDDASTDDSAAVAVRLAGDDERIRVIVHETNLGHIATYNDGLARVRGDYVVLLSADDLLAPGALGRAVALMERRPDVGLVYGYARTFSTGETLPIHQSASRRRVGWSVWAGEEWIARMCARGSNTIVNPEAVLRRAVMDSLGGYDAALPQTADMELWMRAAARSGVGRVNGPEQGFYRVHGENMHLTLFGGPPTDLLARREAFAYFFARDGARLRHAEELHLRARSRLAREAVRNARLLAGVSRSDPSVGAARRAAADRAAFATETWPTIVRSPEWRVFQHRFRQPVGPSLRWVDESEARIRGALRWRRWRRFGT